MIFKNLFITLWIYEKLLNCALQKGQLDHVMYLSIKLVNIFKMLYWEAVNEHVTKQK